MQTAQPEFRTDSDVVAVRPEANKLTAYAAELVITTAEQYETAASYLMTIKGLLAKIEDARTRITQPLNASLRETNRQAKEAAAPLEAAEKQIKEAISEYTDEQERIRQEEQAKAEAAARKEQEKLQARAAAAAASGKLEKADQLAAQASTVVAPIVERAPPKVAGIRTSEVWKFAVTDPKLVPREYLLVDESKIRKVVSAMKGDTSIPGVRVWPENQIAAGAR